MIKRHRPILLSLVLGLLLPLFASAAETSSPAPPFKLPDLDGKSVQLSDFKGKVVLLNFWATWCPPCRAEIPDLVALQQRYAPRGVVVLGISLDQGGPAKVASFVKRIGINYPVLMGNRDIALAYGGIEVVPTSFVIDRKGNVAGALRGATDLAGFEAALKPALESK